jgi:hypothetical protein
VDSYRILVQGEVDPGWAVMFGDVRLTWDGHGNTALIGDLPDQAALHGLLARCRDLGLTLVSVARLDARKERLANAIRASDLVKPQFLIDDFRLPEEVHSIVSFLRVSELDSAWDETGVVYTGTAVFEGAAGAPPRPSEAAEWRGLPNGATSTSSSD